VEAQLTSLSRVQDEFRNSLSVGLSEMKNVFDAVQREHASEVKARVAENEQSRRALEVAMGERTALETKLMQCEQALMDTKHALMEMKEKAKDASVANSAEKKDLLFKLETLADEKKKSEDSLKAHYTELKQQLIMMQNKLERAGEIDKELQEKMKAQEIGFREKSEEYKRVIEGLRSQLQDRDSRLEAGKKETKQHEQESLRQHDAINRLESKIESLSNQLESSNNQCVQWQRESDMAKAAERAALDQAAAAKEERMKQEKARSLAEAETDESRRKCAEALEEAAENKQNRKLAEAALEVKESELKEFTHKAQMMEKDFKEALRHEKEEHAATEDRLESLKAQSFELYNAYTSMQQQLEEYRAALERESQESANLHAALAKQKEEAARDALRSRSSKLIAPPSGYNMGSPSPSRNGRSGVSINDFEGLRSPPSFAD
jgi:myosin heavy subunit